MQASAAARSNAIIPAHASMPIALLEQVCCAGAFMSPDGQKALIAGGCTAFVCDHVPMQRDPDEYTCVPLADLFELDLNTTCWVQVSFCHATFTLRHRSFSELQAHPVALCTRVDPAATLKEHA